MGISSSRLAISGRDGPPDAGRVAWRDGAAGKRGDAELLAHVPAFSDPLRACRRRERPDVVTGAVTKTARLPASKGP